MANSNRPRNRTESTAGGDWKSLADEVAAKSRVPLGEKELFRGAPPKFLRLVKKPPPLKQQEPSGPERMLLPAAIYLAAVGGAALAGLLFWFF